MGLLTKAASTAAVEAAVAEYGKRCPALSGVILEVPSWDDGKGAFFQKLVRVTALFGAVTALPSGRCLVLLPQDKDKELIAHRLGSSLGARTPLLFDAESPEQAFKILRPYL